LQREELGPLMSLFPGPYDSAISILEKVFQQQPSTRTGQLLCELYLRRGGGWAGGGPLARAGQQFGEAARGWLRGGTLGQGHRRVSFRFDRSAALAPLGRHEPAEAEVEAFRRDGLIRYHAAYRCACSYSVCVTAARQDAGLSADARDKLVERYTTRAFEL